MHFCQLKWSVQYCDPETSVVQAETAACRMLHFLFSEKLTKNINEKFVTLILSSVSRVLNSDTDCDLSIRGMPYIVERGHSDGMGIVDYR